MRARPIYGFFVMNRLTVRVTLPSDTNIVQLRYFSYFSCSRDRRAVVSYHQALGLWSYFVGQ